MKPFNCYAVYRFPPVKATFFHRDRNLFFSSHEMVCSSDFCGDFYSNFSGNFQKYNAFLSCAFEEALICPSNLGVLNKFYKLIFHQSSSKSLQKSLQKSPVQTRLKISCQFINLQHLLPVNCSIILSYFLKVEYFIQLQTYRA